MADICRLNPINLGCGRWSAPKGTHASRREIVSLLSFAGRGGSPPGSQEALLEATRLTMWKLYNHGLGGSLGGAGEDDAPRLPPPHLPMGGGPPPHPPQKEALNLDVKDDVSGFFLGFRVAGGWDLPPPGWVSPPLGWVLTP